MKDITYHIYLDEAEYSRVIEALISLKNDLIRQVRFDIASFLSCRMLTGIPALHKFGYFCKNIVTI